MYITATIKTIIYNIEYMIVIDTGASYPTYFVDDNQVIPIVDPSLPVSVSGALLVGEFGMSVSQPPIGPNNYNSVFHSGTIGVKSVNQNRNKIKNNGHTDKY